MSQAVVTKQKIRTEIETAKEVKERIKMEIQENGKKRKTEKRKGMKKERKKEGNDNTISVLIMHIWAKYVNNT